MRVLRSCEQKERLRHLPLITIVLILVFCAPLAAQTPPIGAPTPQPPVPTGLPSPAPTVKPMPPPKPVLVRLQADRIAFYYDRFLVEADGHVRITTSNGMTLAGDTFSMDLRLNRFLLAGHTHLRSAGGNIDGAAIADFIDFDRIYFVPVISKPDRWTYENGDFRTPLKGRIMPGDVFYFPDLGRRRPDLVATSATVQSKSYVRFGGVRANLLMPGIPLETFYVYFGQNRDLAQNSLSGANYDATWNMTGNANSITAIHVRDDTFNHVYLGFEQHFAGTDPHEYAVFSVSPFTTLDRYWNLVTGEHIGSKFEIDSLSQLYTDKLTSLTPEAAALTTYITATQGFPHSYMQFFGNQTNYNLLGPAQPAIPNHPNYGQLTWTSTNNRIFKTPFYEQTSFSMGFNHDAYGLEDYGGVEYTTLWNQLASYTISLPNVKIGNRDRAYALYYLNASFNSSRQWYTIPHHINEQNTSISLSRQFSRFLNSYLAYTEANTSDLYLVGGYEPSEPLLPNGQPFESFAAFRGASSLRTTTLGTTYSSSPNFVTTITAMHHDDFPLTFPGLYALPPTNAIGQYTYSNYLGQAPWSLTGEVRTLLLPHIMIDVQRTYYFHFGSQTWSPTFAVQISGTE
jgi:hypothetical protein